MNYLRKITAVFLTTILLISALPLNAFAAEKISIPQPTDKSVIIDAEAEDPITIKAPDALPVQGSLGIWNESFAIDRDYEQSCILTVKNYTDKAQTFYLVAENTYSDLSLEIIKDGSKSKPVEISPHGLAFVELSVFAQNAERTNYSVPVKAYINNNGEYTEDASRTIRLSCTLPELSLKWELISDDSTTLAKKYRITNNGDTLSDLNVSADANLVNDITFSPIITNYELTPGSSVEFSVYPDLVEMKTQGLTKLEGNLTASSAGNTSTYACVFDTKGQDISVTTLGDLARKQNGNPFTDFAVIEDTLTVETYIDGKYEDVSDKSISDILDSNQLFNVKFGRQLDLGVDNPVNMSFVMKSC